jgi:hypothetical protein
MAGEGILRVAGAVSGCAGGVCVESARWRALERYYECCAEYIRQVGTACEVGFMGVVGDVARAGVGKGCGLQGKCGCSSGMCAWAVRVGDGDVQGSVAGAQDVGNVGAGTVDGAGPCGDRAGAGVGADGCLELGSQGCSGSTVGRGEADGGSERVELVEVAATVGTDGVGRVLGEDRLGRFQVVRGPNWERNNERRKKKKLAKANKKLVDRDPSVGSVPEWRRRAGTAGTASVSRGYFSELSADVQVELKETRAKLLIEKNKRELLQEQQKVKFYSSPMAAVGEVMKALAVVERVAKKENDGKILGWVKSVSESYASSVSGVSEPVTVASSVSANSSSSAALQSARAKWALAKEHASGPESVMMAYGKLSEEALVLARKKLGRKLNSNDFLKKDSSYKLKDSTLRWKIEQADE